MNTEVTISINEYNRLKDKIHQLESEIVSDRRNFELIENKYIRYKESLDYLFNNTTALERFLQWKSVKKAVLKHIGN